MPLRRAGWYRPPMKPIPPGPVPTDTRALALHDAISAQARKLWERYGRPEGRDVAIWLEAQSQVLGVDPAVNQQPGGAVSAAKLGEATTPRLPEEPAPAQPVPPAAASAPSRSPRRDRPGEPADHNPGKRHEQDRPLGALARRPSQAEATLREPHR